MSSQIRPIKVWGKRGPNPPKVAMILKELGIPYEAVQLAIKDTKSPEYLAVNPNGRIPAIYDPNTDLTLWESGAIIEYLMERYDTEHRLSFPSGTNESYLSKQWLYFQTSGQGPYYGQASWFKKYHSEHLPSAIERYTKETNRVTGVLETHLAHEKSKYGDSSDGPWLVGNKMTYADISFIMWQLVIGNTLENDQFNQDDFPLVKAWLDKMREREAVSVVLEELLAQSSLRK